jgi:hypothetical protein
VRVWAKIAITFAMLAAVLAPVLARGQGPLGDDLSGTLPLADTVPEEESPFGPPVEGAAAGSGNVSYIHEPPPSMGIFEGFPSQVYYTSDWFNRGDWYTQQDAMILNRGKPRPQAISGLLSASQGQILVFGEFLTTQSARLRTSPGTRITIGRRLGRDMENRDREMEFTFLGLFEWEGQNQLTSTPASNQQQIFLIEDPFVGGFSGVQFHRMTYGAKLNSFEANYRLQFRPGMDRMLMNPDGTWVRESNAGWVPTLRGGLRYLMLDENFHLEARGQDPDERRGDYIVATENDLIGLQVGFDLEHHAGWWNLGVRNTLGGFVNFTNQRSLVTFVDTEDIPANRDEIARATPMAFIGELQLYGSVQLVTNVYLRAAWDLQYIQGLALAPEQLHFVSQETPIINLSGFSVNTGLSLGFEMNW